MDVSRSFQDRLIMLYNEIVSLEEHAVIPKEFSDITNNDMHVIEAIGVDEARNMSAVAKSLGVTTGTLTIAVNNLVKKAYVSRERSHSDRRVVLVSLTPRGKKAYDHHKEFHHQMILATMKDLDEKDGETLLRALGNLRNYFKQRQRDIF